MIRNEKEYQEASQRLDQDKEVIRLQKEALIRSGLNEKEVETALQPSLCFHAQLLEEVETYEKLKRKEFEPLTNLVHIGRLIIGARIALGISQKELANKLSVTESSVSRDEKNEYHGISVERAQRILEALGVRIKVEVEDLNSHAA